MHVEPGMSAPKLKTVSLSLDPETTHFTAQQIAESRTYQPQPSQLEQLQIPHSSNKLSSLGSRRDLLGHNSRNSNNQREDPQPQFVRTYLEKNGEGGKPKVAMRKGDFLPHVFEPVRPLLPLPGAELTASQYLFLEREQAAEEHVLVSAELKPLSKTMQQKQAQNNLSSNPSHTGSSSRAHSGRSRSAMSRREDTNGNSNSTSAEPRWRTVEHFRHWQNAVLKAEFSK